MDEIFKCYRVLAVVPGTPLKAIKKTYRSLVKKFHPDQFAGNPVKRREAEEKLKEINLAFERIQQSPIVLPTISRRPQPSCPQAGAARPRSRKSPGQQSQRRTSEPAGQSRGATPKAARTGSKPKKRNQNNTLARTLYSWQMGLAVAAAISVGWLSVYLWSPPKKKGSATRSNQQQRPPSRAQKNPVRVSPSRSVTWDSAKSGTRIPSAPALSDLANILSSADNDPSEHSASARVPRRDEAPSPSNLNPETVRGNPEPLRSAGGSKPPPQTRNDPADPVRVPYDPNGAQPLITETLRDVLAASATADPDPSPTPEEIADADFQRGLDHANGRGVPKDIGQAALWYRRAAEAGHVEAQKNLGFLYATGKGVEKDETEATKWMGRSASKGNSDASLVSGLLALSKKQSDDAAHVRSIESAAKDSPREEGRSPLFKALMNRSSGTQTNSHVQPAEPPKELDAQAQFERGLKYANGVGVKQDFTESAIWYRRAAEAGHTEAQKKLGFLYATGRGVGQDYAEAEKWFRKAAEKGAVGAAVTKANAPPRDSEDSDVTRPDPKEDDSLPEPANSAGKKEN